MKDEREAQKEEEFEGQDDAMETEQQPVGPVQQASMPPQVDRGIVHVYKHFLHYMDTTIHTCSCLRVGMFRLDAHPQSERLT